MKMTVKVKRFNLVHLLERMVSRWAFDQFSNTIWTLRWRCLTGWRLTAWII